MTDGYASQNKAHLNAVAEIGSIRPVEREAVGPIYLDRGNDHPPLLTKPPSGKQAYQ
jgi:hypothetical protein